MRTIILLLFITLSYTSYGQLDERISTVSFVQVVDDNKEETIFYFQNNWKVLRDMAIEKGYIHSYQVMETPYTQEGSSEVPFDIILITTYSNQTQYDLREDHFGELIEQRGKLRLMNDKQPDEFRKTLFSKERVRHWE